MLKNWSSRITCFFSFLFVFKRNECLRTFRRRLWLTDLTRSALSGALRPLKEEGLLPNRPPPPPKKHIFLCHSVLFSWACFKSFHGTRTDLNCWVGVFFCCFLNPIFLSRSLIQVYRFSWKPCTQYLCTAAPQGIFFIFFFLVTSLFYFHTVKFWFLYRSSKNW